MKMNKTIIHNINNIRTWQRGKVERRENLFVRSDSEGTLICMCKDPSDAKWIAERLNLASILEEMAYNFATGKTGGRDIVAYVRKKLDEI